jgi:hypothetical protein
MCFQKPAEHKPIMSKLRMECTRVRQPRQQLLGISPSTKLCVDKKSISQSEMADKTRCQYPGLCLSCFEKKVRRWLADINVSFSIPLLAFSNASCDIMSKPAQDKVGAETRAEDIVFNKDVMRLEAWRGRITDELNAGDERSE